MKNCAPKLNPKKDPKAWLSNNAAPWAKLGSDVEVELMLKNGDEIIVILRKAAR